MGFSFLQDFNRSLKGGGAQVANALQGYDRNQRLKEEDARKRELAKIALLEKQKEAEKQKIKDDQWTQLMDSKFGTNGLHEKPSDATPEEWESVKNQARSLSEYTGKPQDPNVIWDSIKSRRLKDKAGDLWKVGEIGTPDFNEQGIRLRGQNDPFGTLEQAAKSVDTDEPERKRLSDLLTTQAQEINALLGEGLDVNDPKLNEKIIIAEQTFNELRQKSKGRIKNPTADLMRKQLSTRGYKLREKMFDYRVSEDTEEEPIKWKENWQKANKLDITNYQRLKIAEGFEKDAPNNPQARLALLKILSRMSSDEALSDEELRNNLDQSTVNWFKSIGERAFTVGSKISSEDADNAVQVMTTLRNKLKPRMASSIQGSINSLKAYNKDVADNYTDQQLWGVYQDIFSDRFTDANKYLGGEVKDPGDKVEPKKDSASDDIDNILKGRN